MESLVCSDAESASAPGGEAKIIAPVVKLESSIKKNSNDFSSVCMENIPLNLLVTKDLAPGEPAVSAFGFAFQQGTQGAGALADDFDF